MNNFGASAEKSIYIYDLTISMVNGDKFRIESVSLEHFDTIKDGLDTMEYLSAVHDSGNIIHWIRTTDISSLTISKR